MTYSASIALLLINLNARFNDVTCFVETVGVTGTAGTDIRFPGLPNGDDWIDFSPTDQKEILYIRRNGDDEVVDELKLSSCSKAYNMRSPLRIVFFKDHATNQAEIIFNLMQSILVAKTKLRSIKYDKWKLVKEESSGDYKFGASTVYLAIDFYLLWELTSDNCEQNFC